MKTVVALLFVLTLSCAAVAQKKRSAPRQARKLTVAPKLYSSVFDIRNFERFYVLATSADSEKSAAAILKALSSEKSIEPVADFKSAEFVFQYREVEGKSELQIFYLNNRRRIVVVWTEERDGAGHETELTEAFLEVLRRNKKPDQPVPPADAA